MNFVFCVVFIFSALVVPRGSVFAAGQPPEETLKALVAKQKSLLAEAQKETSQEELEDLRQPLQNLCFEYEEFLRKNPNMAAGYVSFAMLLDNPVIDERRRATALLLKANQLDSELPLVKNQLGNHVAELGKPLEAVNYFLAAIRLDPKEPLYHYQLGTLLAEARDDFLKSGEWNREKIEKAMQHAFSEAAALAPDNWRYKYRYGLSFYEVEHPDWNAALEFWTGFESSLKPGVEQQTCRLHRAKVLLAQGKHVEAAQMLQTVDEAALAKQKEKLAAEIAAAENPPAGNVQIEN